MEEKLKLIEIGNYIINADNILYAETLDGGAAVHVYFNGGSVVLEGAAAMQFLRLLRSLGRG